jgi:DNA-binding NtrC family response regulator
MSLPSKPVLLLVDDDRDYLDSLEAALRGEYEARKALSKTEALDRLSPPPQAILLDVHLRGKGSTDEDGVELLSELRAIMPHVPVLMATGDGDVGLVVRCLQLGALDFLQKGRSSPRAIKARLDLVLKHAREAEDAQTFRHKLEPHALIGCSPHIESLRETIAAVSKDGGINVLIRGETGTGKEVVAKRIHLEGPRQSGRYVPVILSAVPEGLVESELFGCEKGSFTGANERRLGYAEEAHRGVLFLDEIGEADVSIQVKLLRFVEEREVHRIGSNKPIKVDVQILAATNADLEQRVRDGRFRADLYQRLKVFEIFLSPLRERREDIGPLINHFLTILSRGNPRGTNPRVPALSSQAQLALERFDWPGNVRQLKNVIESSLIHARIANRERIDVLDLPSYVLEQAPSRSRIKQVGDVGFCINEALARTELAYIEEALRKSGGSIAKAGEVLGYGNRFRLRSRLKRIQRAFPSLVADVTKTYDNAASDSTPAAPKQIADK